MWHCVLLLVSSIAVTGAADATETEMLSISLTPKMFNWTYQEFDKQYVYHPSLIAKPDLPNWLHYVYSGRHQLGFIYGTPPLGQKDITIVALNKEDYETRRLVIPLYIKKKSDVATHHVQIKIDNLNVEDLLDEYRMEKLKDIFRKKLWKENAAELYTTFMASAIEMGARLPLRPSEGEGVVLKLGSHKDWSQELIQLQEEVKPLSKMTWCPRDFKRTTVERLFRDAGFNLDWCAFRLVEHNMKSLQPDKDSSRLRVASDTPSSSHMWIPLPPTKAMVPQRSYAHEFTFIILLPMLIIILIFSGLSVVLCFHHDGIEDTESEIFFRDIFHICSDYMHHTSSHNRVSRTGNKVEYQRDMSGMTLANTGTSEVLLGDDPNEKDGISPSNSLKPKASQGVDVDFSRPQPPPYLGSNTNTLVQRRKTDIDGDHLANRALEESLQILNEANISNRPLYRVEDVLYPEHMLMGDILISDSIGGNAVDEDYVLIKPEDEMGHGSLRRGYRAVRNGNNVNNGVLKGYGNKI